MSVNRYQPHVLVLPEDDANRQVATGFTLDPSMSLRAIQVLAEAGGWTQVLDHLNSDHVVDMERFPNRHIVLLIDFDGDRERLTRAKARIPAHLTDRVFVIGALTRPEALRQANLGTYEKIGLAMARDCRDGTDEIWGHDLLRHNASELDRMRAIVRPILFPTC